MVSILHMEFMRNAILATLLAAVACGIIAPLIVVNRLVFLSGGIAHAAYGGVGLALFIGFEPFYGALGFSILVAIVMGLLTYRNRYYSDAVIGALWAVGMAVGVLLIDLTPGYNVDLMSYLFGSILTVSRPELEIMTGLDIIIAGVILGYYQQYLAISYDEEFALAMGVPAYRLYLTLLVLVAMTVVILIRIVGLVLVIALLAMPSYISQHCSTSLAKMMIYSGMLCAFFSLVGLLLAYELNLTSGATIIIVTAAGFFLFIALSNLKHRRNTHVPPL